MSGNKSASSSLPPSCVRRLIFRNREPVVDQMLGEQSRHIEYNQYLTNHEKHAVIALEGLGVPGKVNQDWNKNYVEDNPYGLKLEPARKACGAINSKNWKSYLGKKTHFPDFVQFFEQEEKRLGIKILLQTYGPVLMQGSSGALLHGVIHLGWAIDAYHRAMIIEGLSYMAFTYVTTHIDTKGENNNHKGVLDSLEQFLEDKEKLEVWAKKVANSPEFSPEKGFHSEIAMAGLQYHVAKLQASENPAIKSRPQWIDNLKIKDLWQQIYYGATLFYLARPGDFVVLHILTGLWGLEHIVSKLKKEDQRDAIARFWSAILVTAVGSAYLSTLGIPGLPEKKALQVLHQKYSSSVDKEGDKDAEENWNTLVKAAVDQREEHNIKLVYVMRKLWERYDRHSLFRVAAANFTDTPSIPKSDKK